jgi:hypothetical protein
MTRLTAYALGSFLLGGEALFYLHNRYSIRHLQVSERMNWNVRTTHLTFMTRCCSSSS